MSEVILSLKLIIVTMIILIINARWYQNIEKR